MVETIESLLGGISHFSVDSGRSGDGVGSNLGFNDIAVLYRTHAMGEELQQAFARSGIPYQRAARKDIFQRADVRNVLALLALAAAPEDDAVLQPEIPAALSPLIAEMAVAVPACALLLACRHAGVSEELLAQPPWTLFLDHAHEAVDLPALLCAVNLDREPDLYDPRAARVALMTVHAAKGLEWDTVFLIGCEEGSFPHPAAHEDEERRLFYVGMTRARRQLYLTYAHSRTLHGERRERRMSPFIHDIGTALLNIHRQKVKRRDSQLTMRLTLDDE